MIFHDEEGVHMSETDYAERVERVLGPCGHPRAFTVKGMHVPDYETWNGTPMGGHDEPDVCKICREIEQAVEREVAGMREACGQVADTMWIEADNPREEHLRRRTAARIRSLDSSAAARGKQRIWEEALKEAARLVCKHCANRIAAYKGETRDEYWHSLGGLVWPCWATAIQLLIDKPGGR